jgi:hypothetical protein
MSLFLSDVDCMSNMLATRALVVFACRVAPIFRGYTGREDEESYRCFREDLDEDEIADFFTYDPALINHGRPLQPAQQKDNLTTEPNAYWALMVGDFNTCAAAMDRQATCICSMQHSNTRQAVHACARPETKKLTAGKRYGGAGLNQAAACDAQPLLCSSLYHFKLADSSSGTERDLICQLLTSEAMHAVSISFPDAAQRECWRADARCNTACLAVCSGYQEEAITSWVEDTTDAVGEALGAREEDICWATPVLDEHFTYFSSVLAGKDDSRRFELRSGRLSLCHALCAAIMPLSHAATACWRSLHSAAVLMVAAAL